MKTNKFRPNPAKTAALQDMKREHVSSKVLNKSMAISICIMAKAAQSQRISIY